MAKPYRRIILGLQRLYSKAIPPKSLPPNPISCTQSRFLHSPRPPALWNGPHSTGISPKPSSLNPIFHNSPTPNLNPSRFPNPRLLSFGNPSKLPPFSSTIMPVRGLGGSGLRYRYFSVKNLGKLDGSLRKSVVERPLSSVKSTVSRYREAVGLQAEAFWKRNYLILAGAGGVVLCIALWRVMFGIANTFVGLSEGMAKYGFLALASAMVAFAGMYIRSRFTINPDKIYRIAMRKLNTSAAILEVMGAPLTGTEVRAYVMSGGGPKLKNFKLRIGGKRCFLIFPIRGSERRGLVSVEVKKKKGQYDMRLLAVDIPMVAGPDQRIFLIGDEEEYKVGGGLISELRDPIVKAMAAEKEFDDLDEKEEEEDEEREREEAQRKHQEEEERAVEEAERRRREQEKLESGNS